MKRKWTESEIKILTDNYNKININELCDILCKSKSSIYKKAERLGLCDNANEKWSDEDLDYLINHYATCPIHEIEIHLHRTYNSITLKANKLGIKKEVRSNENMGVYSVNKDYFKNIDTPNKAYFLGWAITDGNIVYGKNNQFRLRLNNNDIDILEKFKIDTCSTTNIYCRNNYAEINICDREFVKNLLQYGFEHDKTRTINFPEIDENFIFDFIKGCFDGDGCYICTNKTKRISFVSASKNFIIRLKDVLHKNNIVSNVYNRKSYYTLEIGRKESKRIFLNKVLNTKSYFLNRKHEKMKLLLNYC